MLRLANEELPDQESATTSELLRILPEIESNGLVDAFCSQLRLLDGSENAKRIVQDLCAANGPFGSAEVIFSKVGSKLLRSIVEINPPVVLDALSRAFSERSLVELGSFVEARRNLVWTVEKLCWEASLFPLATPLLLRLAASENETCANNATGQFLQLYQIFLSGTRRPAIARLDVIKTSLAASQSEQRVCVLALGTAVKSATGPYSRMGGVETRGSQLPQSDWAPSTFQDIADYQLDAFTMLRDIVLSNSPLSGLATAELGDHIRTFLTSDYLDKVGDEIVALARHLQGYWPKARRSIEDMLQ